MLNVVTAPALELGVEQRTWKPVHCAKRASAVRNVCAGYMGSASKLDGLTARDVEVWR